MKRLLLAIVSRCLAFYGRSAQQSHARRKHRVAAFLASLPDGASVIDVGAGESPYRQFAGHLRYTAHDLGEYDGGGDGRGMQSGGWTPSTFDIRSDITRIPVPAGTFDAAICTDVLEHVPDAAAAVREIDRIVRRDGQILITAPTQCETHQSPYFFSGGYHENFYRKHLCDRRVIVEYESGYFETADQKVYLTLLMLVQLAQRERRYVPLLALAFLLCAPVVVLLRRLPPQFEGFAANNGLFVHAAPAVDASSNDRPILVAHSTTQ